MNKEELMQEFNMKYSVLKSVLPREEMAYVDDLVKLMQLIDIKSFGVCE